MKFIEQTYKASMLINYRGVAIVVPSWAVWIAVEEDGLVCVFDKEPEPVDGGYWGVKRANLMGVAKVEDFGNWKETKERVAV